MLVDVAAPGDELVFDGFGALVDLRGQGRIGRGGQRSLRAGRALRGGRAGHQQVGGKRQRGQTEQGVRLRHVSFSSRLLTCYRVRILPERFAASVFVTDT
ncbi:hypothetical protein D9M69_669550 [compost metagenome]